MSPNIFFDQLTDFCKLSMNKYEYYATRGHSAFVLFISSHQLYHFGSYAYF
jgi:hypothetical protein